VNAPAAPVRVLPPTTLAVADLVGYKRGRTISVCLPARNEVATVGPICAEIVKRLMNDGIGRLVDELIVFDDGSTDTTANAARRNGARVVRVVDVLPASGPGRGKGNVLWKSVAESTGDIIVWCDTDLTSFTPNYITRMVTPLLMDDSVDLVKGFYERPLDTRGSGGGRTTELAARPLLSRFFPPLATIRQPLGGECAARRSLLERLPFVQGYGVETGLLIDTLRLAGTDCIAQVDLGIRAHRHRSLTELSAQAAEILAVVMRRIGVEDLDDNGDLPPLITADGTAVPIRVDERPALVDVAEYLQRRA
jgi:glucosyl-3-phosphoglycerate synthase